MHSSVWPLSVCLAHGSPYERNNDNKIKLVRPVRLKGKGFKPNAWKIEALQYTRNYEEQPFQRFERVKFPKNRIWGTLIL